MIGCPPACGGCGRSVLSGCPPGPVRGRQRLAACWRELAAVYRRLEARGEKRIDQRSGVSQRLSITLLENVISNAERRAVRLKEKAVVPRLADIYAALPAITGKIELEYEGELVGGPAIARELIRRASDATFQDRAGGVNVDDVIVRLSAI